MECPLTKKVKNPLTLNQNKKSRCKLTRDGAYSAGATSGVYRVNNNLMLPDCIKQQRGIHYCCFLKITETTHPKSTLLFLLKHFINIWDYLYLHNAKGKRKQ